ncbi:MAG: carbohydrate porin [Tildeniella nuda ZEHNDER 1965/U140]|jgi:porin|nr:carbohydrate porin [Tildeniella nuda ZEHNDER 1965/U140]
MPPLLRQLSSLASATRAFTVLVGYSFCALTASATPISATLVDEQPIGEQPIDKQPEISALSGSVTHAEWSPKQVYFASESASDTKEQSRQPFSLWQETVLGQESEIWSTAESPVPAISYSASDLGGELVADATVAQQPPSAEPPASPPPPFSDAINLPVLRSLKKPVGKKVLDTGVGIAGINLKDPSERFWTRDFLTGNWGGTRDRLLQQGIDFYLAEFLDVYSNVGGGRSQDTAVNNVVLVGLDLYTTKLGWWNEGQIHITAVDIRGVSVGRDYAGSLSSVYFVDPLKRGARLFELWYGQKFGNKNQYELRLGKIFPFVRIAASQTTGIFTNTAFQYPTYLGVSPTSGLSTAFASAPLGIQFSYTPGPQWLFIGQIQDGFDDPTGGLSNQDGLNTRLNAREGVEGIVEAVYRPNQERGSTGLPGYYRFGFQFHSGIFKSQSKNITGQSVALFGGDRKEERGNHALYFMAEQMVWRESLNPRDRTQGLNVFFKTVVSPNQDINTISWNVAGGLAYEGLIPGRDRDVLGLGVSYSRYSNGIRNFDRNNRQINPGSTIRDAETVLELVYVAQIAPWWYLIGSLQRIIHPSGDSGIPDATVVGISSRFAF